jgi:hypothetical protein
MTDQSLSDKLPPFAWQKSWPTNYNQLGSTAPNQVDGRRSTAQTIHRPTFGERPDGQSLK